MKHNQNNPPRYRNPALQATMEKLRQACADRDERMLQLLDPEDSVVSLGSWRLRAGRPRTGD